MVKNAYSNLPTLMDIPVPYSYSFEGERIKKENLQIEFGGLPGLAFEIIISRKEEDIKDGNIEVFGHDLEDLGHLNTPLPLAIIVNVYGHNMQEDFEPVLERRISHFINCALGVTHSGQRDTNLIRISKDAFLSGFRLKHLGVILNFMLRQEYGAIIDKVEVKIYTNREDVSGFLIEARRTFHARDERLNNMSDESTDVYYSCLICQSSPPRHICIITPERLGLCGAYSWLDAKASYKILATGPNRPILKGEVLDERLGQWRGVNEFIEKETDKNIKKISIYSLMNSPMTSSSLLECIVAVIPEANGVMVVSRDYSGMTPLGMDFNTLVNLIGQGIQTPGFLGIARRYIVSNKFISAEGGIRRLVWMPKQLKAMFSEKMGLIAQEINEPDLLEHIADEGVAQTLEELLGFLSRIKHPVLSMGRLI